MKKTTYYVKALTAIKPGMLKFKTIKTFEDFHKADEWLCRMVRENHYDMRDFTISTKA